MSGLGFLRASSASFISRLSFSLEASIFRRNLRRSSAAFVSGEESDDEFSSGLDADVEMSDLSRVVDLSSMSSGESFGLSKNITL